MGTQPVKCLQGRQQREAGEFESARNKEGCARHETKTVDEGLHA